MQASLESPSETRLGKKLGRSQHGGGAHRMRVSGMRMKRQPPRGSPPDTGSGSPEGAAAPGGGRNSTPAGKYTPRGAADRKRAAHHGPQERYSAYTTCKAGQLMIRLSGVSADSSVRHQHVPPGLRGMLLSRCHVPLQWQ